MTRHPRGARHRAAHDSLAFAADGFTAGKQLFAPTFTSLNEARAAKSQVSIRFLQQCTAAGPRTQK